MEQRIRYNSFIRKLPGRDIVCCHMQCSYMDQMLNKKQLPAMLKKAENGQQRTGYVPGIRPLAKPPNLDYD